MTLPNDASRDQVRAADPDVSVWVTANAGSGKTKVLTDRVARLLLAGTPPARILCLTYTRAAAAEMQLRLFERLGEWAMLADGALSQRLVEMGLEPGAIDAEARARARRLFARALETPGGLKIQTIHSFCAALLRRFPLEAGVPPGFSELDERAAKLLQDAVIEEMAEAEPAAFDALAAHLSGDDLAPLVTEILRERSALAAPAAAAEVFATLGLPDGYDATALIGEVFTGGEAQMLGQAIAAMRASNSETDQKKAKKLAALGLAMPDVAALEVLEVLEDVFLYGAKAKAGPFAAKIDVFPTRATRARDTGWLAPLEALMRRVEAARPRRLALAAAKRTLALHRFAAPFLARYEAHKAARGALDFDDLVERARALVEDVATAQWVLWKLDGGIEHILVDEAQDTSPGQWRLIRRLSEAFTAAAPRAPRTVFVVGDEKQSIYSFQGADPAAFAAMRATFAENLSNGPAPLIAVPLHYSFRSAEAVLRVVDATFTGPAAHGVGAELIHRPFKNRMAGRVDLWPMVPRPEAGENPPWDAPVDATAPGDPRLVLARQIAAWLAGLFARGERLETEGREGLTQRPLTPGDVLILVQRRSELFHGIIRELKAAGLPVAGADRLRMGGELAVKDLTALLSFLAAPEDDLSLAAVLRSPLFGWSEDALFRLAHDRQGSLWQALRGQEATYGATLAVLSDLLDRADFLRPYEMLERVLTRHDGRRRIVARLGAEAEEGIDALLAQALAYERGEVPSLPGFLAWLAAAEVEIKRQTGAAGDAVRVMSVHGAKGLQAPLVILPDTAATESPLNRALLSAGPVTLWAGRAEDLPSAAAEVREALRNALRAERQRLLYVAMTRAENWLVVCGAAPGRENAEALGWHRCVADGMQAAGAVRLDAPTGPGLRVDNGHWPGATPKETGGAPAPTGLPGWARQPAPAAPRPPAPLSPSGLGGTKALPGETVDGARETTAALAHGTRVHRALEVLPGQPAGARADILARLFAAPATPPGSAALAALVSEVLAEVVPVLDAPGFAHLFAPGTLAEAPLSARLAMPGGGTRVVQGTADRLLMDRERVLAVDFKTNALIPGAPEDVPEGLLRQMGAYAAALDLIFPGRRIEVALLWTRAARVMPLPHDLVMEALERGLAEVALLDRAGGGA